MKINNVNKKFSFFKKTEDIKIKTLENQNNQNEFLDSDEFPPDTDSNYPPYEDYSSPSLTQDKEISKTTQSSKA